MATTDIEKLVVQLSADVRSYQRSLDKARGATNRTAGQIERRFAQMNTRINSAGKDFFRGLGLGALAGVSVQGITQGISDLIKRVGSLNDEAQKIGVNVEGLQALGFAATQNGVEIETLTKGLAKLNLEVGKAKTTGKGKLFDIFEANRLQFSEDPFENFRNVAELIRNARNEQEKAVIGAAAFGKAYADLLPLLNQGAEGIRKMEQEARTSGQVIDKELVQAADDFGDAWDKAFGTFQGQGARAILAIGVEIQKLIQQGGQFGKLLEGIVNLLPGFQFLDDLNQGRNPLFNLELFGRSIAGGSVLDVAKTKVIDLQSQIDTLNRIRGPKSLAVTQQIEQLTEELIRAKQQVGALEAAISQAGFSKAGGQLFGGVQPGLSAPLSRGPTIVPGGDGDGADTFDKAVDKFVKVVLDFENAGGRNIGKNPLSSASGVGQFLESTWLDLFRKNYPAQAQTMGRDAILALRDDAKIATNLITQYAKDNAAVLQKAGESVTVANLQLAHFLGPGGALKVLQAPAGTPVSQVLPPDVINANRGVLAGKTTDQVIAEANARAGLSGAIREQSAAFQQLLADNQADIDGMKIRQAELGATTESQKAYARELELTNQLRAQGVNVDDPGVQAMIKEEAARWASAKQALDDYGNSLDAAKQKAEDLAAAQEQAAQTAQQIAGAFGSAFQGFISDLAQGKKLTDALRDALMQLGQSLLNIALQNLQQSLFGGLGGGLGGGAGLLGGLFHQGGIAGQAGAHRLVPASAFAGAYRYHSGGFAGLRPGEVPAILKKGEPVLESMDQLKGLVMAAKRGGMGAGYGGGAIVQNVQFIAPDVKTMARSRNQLARSAGTDLERVRRTL